MPWSVLKPMRYFIAVLIFTALRAFYYAWGWPEFMASLVAYLIIFYIPYRLMIAIVRYFRKPNQPRVHHPKTSEGFDAEEIIYTEEDKNNDELTKESAQPEGGYLSILGDIQVEIDARVVQMRTLKSSLFRVRKY